MEIILKYKNRIAIGISVIAVIILIIFLSFKFSGNSDKEVAYDFSKPYSKIEFIKDEMYIFEKNKFLRFNKNGKLKLEKEIENNGKIRVSNDVIYSLMPNEIIMYSKNFDEIKRISLEKEIQDFIIENNKLILINNASFKIFDENLTEIYSNEDVQNPGYVKFSKSKNNFAYTDYVKYENSIKSRFHILNAKDKSTVCDFTFFNEFIIEFGFVNDLDDKLFVATNEKLYLFEKNIIKNQYYIKNLKNVVYDSGKIYLFSEDLKVFNAKDLKLEKTVDIGDDYVKSYILSKDILLVKKNGYVLIDKATFKTKEFSGEIVDSIQSEDSVYLIQKDKYKKIK
ncbi:hypothetical protein [Parvimonas sp. D9]|uniref:hypothetical protein n=1 Tax=Parvimonas sp. D9 TaxID=3110689 RepID=UPI002B476A91|nr:hypothetical protein [Parvimonas sp. D9]MEB3058474.1 hypothetical protein [Parvimonas sp. D9]